MSEFEFLHHSDLTILLRALYHGADEFRPLAGGTDLVPLIRRGIIDPAAVLDISRVEALHHVSETPGSGMLIGALVTLDEIATHPRIRARFPALAQAAGATATPQIRSIATLGGNLLQRPRCPYFRGETVCWLKGGEECLARDGGNVVHGIFEDGVCVAVHPSDAATVLYALDAAIHVQSAWTDKVWPVDRFLRPPFHEYRDESSLDARELITLIQVPEPPEGLRSVYVRESDPAISAFALVGVALAAVVEGQQLRDARLALGGVATVPRRATEAEQLLTGVPLDEEHIDAAIAAALEGARPLSENSYKLPLLTGAIRAALQGLLEP